jgi:uncharacterized membrane protein YkoI
MNKRKLAAAGVLAAVLVGGGASIASASGSAIGPTATATTGAAADSETNDGSDGGSGSSAESNNPSYVGSVPAPADNQPDNQGTAAAETQETAALQSLATVTSSQADQAGLAAVPGTVQQTQLENENGSVVYSVQIKGADGTVTDVKVDAGNGKVLAQQVGDGETADGSDQPEGPGDTQD